MITRERLEAMASEQVRELLEDRLELRRTAADVVDAAIKAYFPAVSEQERMVEERKTDLTKERDRISARIEGMRPELVKATIAGDADKLAELQQTMTELETQRATVNTQIEMLSGPLPRCDDAYNAVQTARQEKEAVDEQIAADLKTIREFCKDKAQPWMELAEKAVMGAQSENDFYLQRIERHYRQNGNQ